MGKKSSKSKTTATPWGPAQGAITSALNTVQSTVTANQPRLEGIANQVGSYLPGLGEKAFGEQAGVKQGMGYLGDVLGGKYLGAGNPYLNQMVGLARDNVANDVNSRFGASGRSLSGQHEGVLGQKMMDAELGLRYGDYNQERQNMQQAAGLLPGMTQAQYAGVMPYIAAAQTAGTLPYAGLDSLGSTIGLAQGSGTTTSKQKQAWGPAVMNAIAAGAQAAAMSDVRAKDDVTKVGQAGPLGIYEWTYKQGMSLPEGRFRGVLAHEVAQHAPHLLGPVVNGLQTVHYTPERIG